MTSSRATTQNAAARQEPADDTVEDTVDVLVVGAGQGGLGVGYWLRRRTALSFLIVDAAPELGHSWRTRWDSLVLFTPRRFSALPGRRFPRGASRYPSKDETADYLRDYAHGLPVRLRTPVQSLRQDSTGYVATTPTGRIRARQIVVASGPFSGPYLPPAARDLDPRVQQLHSSEYCRPSDVTGGDLVVVGAGNSAAQLAVELSATHRVTVVAPGGMWFLPTHVLGISLYRWIYLTGVLNGASTTRTSRLVRSRGDGIIGRQLQRLIAAGTVPMIEQRVVGADGSALLLSDGTTVAADVVLWCTGFRPELSWLQVAGALNEQGLPVHHEGRSPVPGLHWIGLPWQTRLNSGILDGVDRDARAVVTRLASSAASTGATGDPAPAPTSMRLPPPPGAGGRTPPAQAVDRPGTPGAPA